MDDIRSRRICTSSSEETDSAERLSSDTRSTESARIYHWVIRHSSRFKWRRMRHSNATLSSHRGSTRRLSEKKRKRRLRQSTNQHSRNMPSASSRSSLRSSNTRTSTASMNGVGVSSASPSSTSETCRLKRSKRLTSFQSSIRSGRIRLRQASKEALQKPCLILCPENFCLLHKLNFCANDCSGYF